MKFLRYFLIIGLIALGVIQFFRPEKNTGDYATITAFEAETNATAEVKAILKTNCYDCHSGVTEYPWYAEVAPISFWVDEHVEDGKKHFNVAAWDSYSLKKKDHKLDELIEEVEEGEMPLDAYTWLHGNMTSEEKEVLENWAKGVRAQLQLQMASE
ncbi:cytochrome C [Dokdonia sinensis]|uniref:Cytochrome C n=1 Tax=Dokdonia sinensis TaxID=2479847 RepID=A0A3M0FV31_9FLAO|nr:heme-binding domain-containing protein [Dokdonia sinensis]RMB56355.1 cytochrome C [Dokdonia sinensis]